jgi:hypothetical protein
MRTHMNIKIKNGMAGSNNGRSRYEYTEFLKKVSKKLRRKQGKKEVHATVPQAAHVA